MIVVTRLNGPQFAVNPDLLQRIEATPDTVLTLIDGTKYVIEESPDEVVRKVQEHRAEVIALALNPRVETPHDEGPGDDGTLGEVRRLPVRRGK